MGWIVTDRARGPLTLLAVLWGVVFPAGGEPATAGEVMDRIAADKVLRIGARTDAPPFAFEQDGRLGGFSVELCVAVGQALSMQPGLAGLEGRLVRVNAENRFDMLATGEIDILCGATTATLARREAVSFSIATFLTGVGSAVRADAPPLLREVLVETSPASASDVVVREALQGRRLGVRKGTTAEDWVSGTALATIDGVEITLLEDHFDGLQQVVDGRIDAYFADRAILNGLIRLQGTEAVVTSNKTYTVEPYALAIPRGDDAFRLVIDRALSSLYRSGAIYEIFQRYFGQPPSDVVFFFTATALPE